MKIALIVTFFLPSLLGLGQEIQGIRFQMEYPMMFSESFMKSPDDSLNAQAKVEEKMPEYIDCIRVKNDLVQIFWKYDGSLFHLNVYSNFKEKIYRVEPDGNIKAEKIASRSTVDYDLIDTEVDNTYVYSISQNKGVAVKVWVNDSINYSKNEYSKAFGMQPEISLFTQLHLAPSRIVIGNTAMIMEQVSNVSYSWFQTHEDYLAFLKALKSKKKRTQLMDEIKSSFILLKD